MLGTKYIITNSEYENYKLVEKVESNDKTYNVYENPYWIGYGTIVKNKCENAENKYNCLFGIDNNLYKEYKNKNGEYEIKKGYYYVYIDNIKNTNFENLNPQLNDDFYEPSTSYFAYKTDVNKKIKINTDETIDSIKVMYFDFDKFKTITHETLEITEQNKNELKGKIVSKEDGILMITLPYEKGFNVEVDNKKVDYFEVADAFIGINITSGNHEIRITYKQPGLKLGASVSVVSLLICFIYLKKVKYEKNLLQDKK